jgi:hypothetical protein
MTDTKHPQPTYCLEVRLTAVVTRDGKYPDSLTLGEYTIRADVAPLNMFKRMVAIANEEDA